MTFKDFIKRLQTELNGHGEKLAVDGDPGPKTQEALSHYDVEVKATPKPKEEKPSAPYELAEPEWLAEAHKYEGKKETDSKFVAAVSWVWAKLGLPGYKSLSGSARAWCGFFIAFSLITGGGYAYMKNGAGAANWGRYAQEVHWKENGLPKGAIIHLNHGAGCGSSSGNHVTFMDGQCAPQDIIEMTKDANGVWHSTGKIKPTATFPGFGGNQGNMVKQSWYKVSDICEARWPSEVPLPPRVLVSNGCNGKSATGESTK